MLQRKITPKKETNNQKTPKDSAIIKSKADAHGTGGRRIQHKLLWNGRGLGCRSRPAGVGEDVRETEESRGRE